MFSRMPQIRITGSAMWISVLWVPEESWPFQRNRCGSRMLHRARVVLLVRAILWFLQFELTFVL